MPVESIRDILDWNKALHRELADIYHNSSTLSQDPRAQMLLDYISEHETKLAEAIDHYEAHENGGKVESWVQDYIEKIPFVKEIRHTMERDSTTVDDIIEVTVSAHQQLIQLYKDLTENAKTERQRELFEGLASMESHELMRMVHTGERWQDL